MTSAAFVFILTCLVLGSHAKTVNLFTSAHREIRETGESLTLKCAFTNEDSYWVSWYQQRLEGNVKLISSFQKQATNKSFRGEFINNTRFTLEGRNGKNYLTISDVKISDSAIYHCIGCRFCNIQVLETIRVSVKHGNGTKLDFGDEVSSGVLVYSLSGALIFQTVLIVVLLMKNKRNSCRSDESSSSTAEDYENFPQFSPAAANVTKR